MRVCRWTCVVLLVLISTVLGGDTGTDPAQKSAWGENVGWVNAAPTNGGVTVHFEGTFGWLSGYAWGENIGWIFMGSAGGGPYANTSSNNWGVNMGSAGNLGGYAWGENIGWICFPTNGNGGVGINPTNGQFSGHAWCENLGWLKFKGTSPDYGVRTLAFDTQAQGTPNWWLDHHNVDEGYDAGDGVPASQKYVMDTDPTVAGDYLRITAVSNALAARVVSFSPASPRRSYTLSRRDDLSAGGWSNVVGMVDVPGGGGSQTMQDTNVAARMFYRVNVLVRP